MTEPEVLGVYTYEIYGNEVTGQLTAAEAEKLGARPVAETDGGGDKPTSKARKAANKADTPDDDK